MTRTIYVLLRNCAMTRYVSVILRWCMSLQNFAMTCLVSCVMLDNADHLHLSVLWELRQFSANHA